MLFTKAYLNRFDKISAMTENSHKITQHAECELRVANQNTFLRFQMLEIALLGYESALTLCMLDNPFHAFDAVCWCFFF